MVSRFEELRLLRERWQVPGLQAAAARAREALLRGRRVVSPFADVAGRVDVRGLPISGAVADRRDRAPRRSVGSDPSGGPSAARWAVWEGLDLTGAELWEMSWTELAVHDCVLDDADLTRAAVLGRGCGRLLVAPGQAVPRPAGRASAVLAAA